MLLKLNPERYLCYGGTVGVSNSFLLVFLTQTWLRMQKQTPNLLVINKNEMLPLSGALL